MTDLADRAVMVAALGEIARTVQQRMDEQRKSGRTLTLKVKYSDYNAKICNQLQIMRLS